MKFLRHIYSPGRPKGLQRTFNLILNSWLLSAKRQTPTIAISNKYTLPEQKLELLKWVIQG